MLCFFLAKWQDIIYIPNTRPQPERLRRSASSSYLRHDDDVRSSAHYLERCNTGCSRVVDTAVVAVPEVQLLWVTPRSASERLNVGTELLRYLSSFGDARLWSHRWMQIYIPWIPIFIITTDPLRGSRCWVASFPTLSVSDAERRVYHNRRVSDALHHHRISDTMMNSTHPLVPRTSALTARYCSRVADTAVVQADERRVVRGTKKVAPRRDPST